MSDDEVIELVRLCWEFWARCEPLPSELVQSAKSISKEQFVRVTDRMHQEALQ